MSTTCVSVDDEACKPGRACKQCGADISRMHPNARYCSEECVKDACKLRLSPMPPRKECLQCGSLFQSRRPEAKFCGTLCKHRAAHVKRRPGSSAFRERRLCDECGAPFVARTSTRRYCGVNCRHAAKLVSGRASNTENARRYRREYPDRYREYDRKRNECPIFHSRSRISKRICGALRDVGAVKSSRTFDMLGYTPQELADHLERQFANGMGWHNRGQWHIDHIVPISTAETVEDVIALNQLSNLRPLWACENLAKNSKRTHLI